MVLNVVRSYGQAFWRKSRKKPSRAALASYKKRAEKIERDDQKGQARLAKTAQKARLDDRAREHWLAAMQLGAELQISAKGAKIGGQKVAPEHVEWLQGQTITVGGTKTFDRAGAKAPKLDNLVEAKSDWLSVRTDLGDKVAKELCALGTALCPPLQERLAGLPVRSLRLLVFAKRTDYDGYLAALGHGDATAGRGLCDYGSYQTLVCAEGLSPADLHGLVLHELTHLFFWGASPVAMPDWYAEGLAETFGGQGTFSWDGKKLATGGVMREDRVAAVKAGPIPLSSLFAADVLKLLVSDHDRAMVFYAESQLLMRFLRQPKGAWQKRFDWWENECRGSLAGTNSTARFGDVGPARASFQRLFGEDLDILERAFTVWLAEQ